MRKYIITNCPAYRDINQIHNEIKGFCLNAESKYVHECLCKDITDCPLKWIADICIKEKDKGFVMSRYGMEVPVSQGYDLACRILKEFEIEECENE